ADVAATPLRPPARPRRPAHVGHGARARARPGPGGGMRQDRAVTAPELESRAAVRWPAVIRGALLGLALIVPITIVGAILDRSMDNFDNSGWRVRLPLLIALTFGPARPY